MAKGRFSCAECGKDIACFGHNRAEADRLAAWNENAGVLCDDCRDKKNAAQNTASAEANAAAGLPPLTGSEKQVAWAETLRKNIFGRVEKARAADTKQVEGALDPIELAVNKCDLRHIEQMRTSEIGPRMIDLFVEVLREQTRAVWWIENTNNRPLMDVLVSLKDQIRAKIFIKEPTPEQIEAEEEALLRPSGDPASSVVIDIRQEDNLVTIHFPSIEAANQIVRDMGFKWFRGRWFRKMSEMTGDPLDRMAEAAQRLVAAGYLIRVNDEKARERAISGTFEQEHQRWVSMDSEGRLVPSWGRGDDLYEAAKSILGARYKDKRLRIPVGSIEEVADFSGRYGFRMTREVVSALERHRKAVAGGGVVTDIKEPPQPVKGEVGIPTLEASACAVDPELADE